MIHRQRERKRERERLGGGGRRKLKGKYTDIKMREKGARGGGVIMLIKLLQIGK